MKLICPLCSEDFTIKNRDFKGHIREFHKVEFKRKGMMVINGKPLPKKIRAKIATIEQKLTKVKSELKINIKNKRAGLVEGIDRCFSCEIFIQNYIILRFLKGIPSSYVRNALQSFVLHHQRL